MTPSRRVELDLCGCWLAGSGWSLTTDACRWPPRPVLREPPLSFDAFRAAQHVPCTEWQAEARRSQTGGARESDLGEPSSRLPPPPRDAISRNQASDSAKVAFGAYPGRR
ncbi:hypothetical protein GQ55_7G256100 [Panicum hallii var. hallii]|uniref:Uncharacterized protein n=1 Tax=Panicum hallii var. hallii TaxID=1504633 RepID=A0A2T7CZ05_9POAL|nr:hypothetical protein GQ55_7G256100 [Panicum hallii var. hallii]